VGAGTPTTAAQQLQHAWLSRGPLAWALRPAALLFGLLTAVRRALYRSGALRAQTLSVPVIVVGNLITGGAGKTPTVIAIVAALRRHGYTPGIISRGYGARIDGVLDVSRDMLPAQCGDEPLLMRLRTDAPVVVGRDRVAAARQLLGAHPAVDVLVSDDGLQHLALARDAQVLVFDERGAGNGWLLPAGPLREPLPRTVPARTLVLYNSAAASTPLPGVLARRSLAGVVGLQDWWQGRPVDSLDTLRGRPLLAAAGLAQPQRFFHMLQDAGLTITPLPLPDHHDYRTLPWRADTVDVVLTEKDAIKLRGAALGSTRVWVAPLDFTFDSAFEAALIALLPPPGRRHGNSPA
jgi:tetraacyldisaccharide 4'-kinase